MKATRVNNVCAALLLFGGQSCYSQGTFGNLNFQNPILPLNPVNFFVPITNALPGWTGYVGGSQVNQVVFDTIALDAAAISLQDSQSFLPPLVGNYSVYLQGSSSFAPAQSAAIAQTGQFPQNVKSVNFFAAYYINLQVTVGGQLVPLVKLGSGPNYDILGGDISMFAGQTQELRFTAPTLGAAYIDVVYFSTQPVPEPGTCALMLCGVMLIAVNRARRIL